MNINILQILFQIVNFSILLFLLKKYLYRPILKVLEQRARKIQEGLEAAEKSILEREKLEHDKKKLAIEAEKDAHKILEGARIRAQKMEKDFLEKAHLEAESRFRKSESLSQARMRQLEHELERKFAETVVSTTESMLIQELSLEQQRMIINNQIKRLKSMKIG